MQAVAVPTVKRAKGAAGDFGVGAIGGLGYGLVTGATGSSFLGMLIAAVIAGAAIKGDRGQIIATMAGFFAVASMVGAPGAAAAGAPSPGTM